MAQAARPSLEKCEGVKRTTPRSRSSLACSKPQISCPCPPQQGRLGVGVKEGDVGERGREHGREVEEVGIQRSTGGGVVACLLNSSCGQLRSSAAANTNVLAAPAAGDKSGGQESRTTTAPCGKLPK